MNDLSPALLGVPGGPSWEWREPWNDWLDARDPDERQAWIHSGIAVLPEGRVVVLDHDRARAHVLDPDGRATRTFETGVTQGHGLCVVEDAGEVALWVADNGTRRQREPDGSYARVSGGPPPAAVKMTLDGEHLLRLAAPPLSDYRSRPFSPTGIAVDEAAYGGSGDVWVADGYGASLVHRFTADGEYVASLSGLEGAGRFDCPHAAWIDRRRAVPELYVADRLNHRLQVFDLGGGYLRTVGDPTALRRPGGLAVVDEFLIVSELDARLAVLGIDDGVLGYLGGDDQAPSRAGFPNEHDAHRHPRRPSELRVGRFNSPHGLAADARGNLYVTEFLIGGRLIQLSRVG